MPEQTPRPTEMGVSYSVSVKSNIGNYESADAHISRSEKWNVDGLSSEDQEKLWKARYEYLKAELDKLIKKEYDETSIYGQDNEES